MVLTDTFESQNQYSSEVHLPPDPVFMVATKPLIWLNRSEFTTMYKVDSHWESALPHRELGSVLCDALEEWHQG